MPQNSRYTNIFFYLSHLLLCYIVLLTLSYLLHSTSNEYVYSNAPYLNRSSTTRSFQYTDIALGALMDMLSDSSMSLGMAALSYQDTGEVMNCTMSIARHLRGRRLLPFLTKIIVSMIQLIQTTNRTFKN